MKEHMCCETKDRRGKGTDRSSSDRGVGGGSVTGRGWNRGTMKLLCAASSRINTQCLKAADKLTNSQTDGQTDR